MNELQDKAKELLSSKAVGVVIGYGTVETGEVGPVFITNPDDAGRLVVNDHCTPNLTVYLTRAEIKKLGKPAIVCKGCDAKTIAVLVAEKQIQKDDIVVLGVECSGVVADNTNRLADKCGACDVHTPLNCDVIVKDVIVKNESPQTASAVQDNPYAKVEKLMALPPKERFEYWKKEFSRCIKCYACRQNCPLCYCNVCVVDKNRPVRLDTSATLKGNFAWNILRAFHLAGRCIGCSSCTSACPADIDLDILNLCLAKSAEENFHFKSGYDSSVLPLIGSFSPDDSEHFIR